MLAIWMYSWDLIDWQPAPTDPPEQPDEQPPAPRADAGGGHYEPLGEDYWMVRERWMANEMPEFEKITDRTQDLEQLPRSMELDAAAAGIATRVRAMEGELQQALAAVSNATDQAQKQAAASIAMRLSIDISQLREQYYERAKLIRLLDLS